MPGILGFHPDTTMLIAAGLAIPIGLVLWLNSVKEAMVLITVFLSALGFLAPWLLPLDHLNFLSRVAIGLGGVVVGIILGTLCFRLSQAVLLALIVGGILGGGLAYHDGAFASHPAVVAKSHGAKSRPVPSATHPVTVYRKIINKIRKTAVHLCKVVRSSLQRLPAQQAGGVYALTIGSALITLLVAFIFPELASLAGGVWAGSLLMLGGALIWLKYWQPTWAGNFETALWPQVTFLLLLVIGTALQSRHLFKLRAARKSAKADGGKKSKGSGEKK